MLVEGQRARLPPPATQRNQRENEILDMSLRENSGKASLKVSQIVASLGRKDTMVIVVAGAGISVNAGIPVTRFSNA